MKPQAFLLHAQNLSQSGSSGAAEYRSATSRAYYSVYLEARDLLQSLGIRMPKGGSEHSKLRTYLLESKIKEGIELARLLENLIQSRKEADYDIHLAHAETQKSAAYAVSRALHIATVIAKCASPAVSAQLAAAIQAYKAKTGC